MIGERGNENVLFHDAVALRQLFDSPIHSGRNSYGYQLLSGAFFLCHVDIIELSDIRVKDYFTGFQTICDPVAAPLTPVNTSTLPSDSLIVARIIPVQSQAFGGVPPLPVQVSSN